MGYHVSTLLRFVSLALPLLLLLLAVFGFVVDLAGLEPRDGSVVRLTLMDQPRMSGQVVLTAWLMEACGLLALYLLAQGRCGAWWLDGLVAGSLGWVFRGPVFVLTLVVAARQPQDPWWRLAFAWWILYAVCGLALSALARRQGLVGRRPAPNTGSGEAVDDTDDEPTYAPALEPGHELDALGTREVPSTTEPRSPESESSDSMTDTERDPVRTA